MSIPLPNRKLPLNDTINYKQLQTEMICWKQEEKRIKTLRECFSLDSVKYSINIGWKGGVYSQMCGHYLHFDCYSSYKKTLDESLSRSSNVEYSCPMCRQIANCVLPVITLSATKQHQQTTPNSASPSSFQLNPPFSLAHSSLSNSPAKLWILSSLADKQAHLDEILNEDNLSKQSIESSNLNDRIINLLKTRPFSTPEFSSKTLTQCKNDALAIITLTTPLEFRYIDQWSPLGSSAPMTSPIDDGKYNCFFNTDWNLFVFLQNFL